jgi:MoaA/NifB/PqqE/SkfB family radical SAM enzyme
MKLPHKKFCVLPWISLETSPIGTVRPCCLAEEEILDDQGKKFDLRQSDLAQVQQSQYMQDLRQKFLAGNQPETCRKCWQEEQAGRTSKRMHTLGRLKHVIEDFDWTLDAKPLMFLDLKLGNICNLKCRICASWSSSTFATEEVQRLPKEKRHASFHYDMLQRGQWPRSSSQFWKQIDQMADQIRYIEFTGGEPFLIDQHFDLLQVIRDRGYAHQVEIHYNTNGTTFPTRGPDLWQHFKTVEIAFSIDDLGDRFEYQRSNAVWLEVYQNLQAFKTLQVDNPNIRLQCCSTVNVFNVMYLEQLANWIDLQGFDHVYWNVLHEARYLSISTLPKGTKQIICEKLQKSQVSNWHRREFARIQDFAMNGESLDSKDLLARITDLDRLRGTDLRKAHLELAEVIGYVGP